MWPLVMLARPLQSNDQLESADQLAAAIDQQIYSQYKLFPSNIIAYQMLGKTEGLEQRQAALARLRLG